MRTSARRRTAGTIGLAAASFLLMAGCGASGEDDSPEDASAATREPGESVTLTFWSWVPGIENAVDLWNSENPDIQVEFERIESGNNGGYAKMFAGVQAGEAPDLAQVEYQAIPSFLIENALVDLAEYGAAEHEDTFVDWQWRQGAIGDSVFAIPQASGPMGMFYRADLFAQWGIEVPTTWAEYEEAARAVRAADPEAYISTFSPASPAWFTGLVMQSGAQWFGVDGDEWSVDIDSPEARQVTDFWQRMIDEDLVKTEPDSSAEWFQDLQEGTIVSWVAGQWGDAIIEGNAPDTAGLWQAAPMPAWDAAEPTAGNHGGSSTAVLAGSEHPAEALEFAVWLNSDPDSVNLLLDGGYGWPASVDALESTTLNEPSDFFGGQAYNEVFAEMDQLVDPSWVWPPTTTATYDALIDGFQQAVAGNATLTDALAAAQEATLQDFEDKGISVVGN